MQILIEVADSGRMNLAAEKLYVSAPFISQTVSSIESELGLKLFERLGKALYLTADGEAVLSYVKKIITAQKQLDDYVNISAKEKQSLKIGATLTIADSVFSDLLTSLSEAGISVISEVNNTKALETAIVRNELDVAVVEGHTIDSHITTVPLMNDKMGVVFAPSHKFAGKKSISVYDLAGEAMFLRESGSGTRLQFTEALKMADVSVNIIGSYSSPNAIKTMVKKGLGITVCSDRIIKPELSCGELIYLDIEDVPLNRVFSIIHHKDKFFSASMKKFFKACTALSDVRDDFKIRFSNII